MWILKERTFLSSLLIPGKDGSLKILPLTYSMM
jgi:hypothetical protein